MASRWIRRFVLAGLCAASCSMAGAQGLTPPGAPQPPPAPFTSSEEALSKMGIVGYADHLSAQPGDIVKFMVSSSAPQYRVDMVRLIHGDANLRGPGVKEEILNTPANREYPGRHQVLPLGSYIRVANAAALQLTGSFTITAWIAPTQHTSETSMATPKVQGILTKWSPADSSGYGLFLDEGRLSLWLGGAGGKVERVTVDAPLRPWVPSIPGTGRNPRPMHVPTHGWYFVAASYDAQTGQVRIVQEPLSPYGFDPTRITVTRATAARALASSTAPLLMAAAWSEGTPAAVTGHYNGKIDSPRCLRARAERRGDCRDPIRQGVPQAPWRHGTSRATWRAAASPTPSPSKLDGVAVNFPTRAVTGHNWTGREMDFRQARAEYGAIYFHDDDLEDAKWEVGFEFTLPANLKSGVYAAQAADG